MTCYLSESSRKLSPAFVDLVMSFDSQTSALHTSHSQFLLASRGHTLSPETMRKWILRISPEHYQNSIPDRFRVSRVDISLLAFCPEFIRTFLWDKDPVRKDLDQGILQWITWRWGIAFAIAGKGLDKKWLDFLSDVFMEQEQLHICQSPVGYEIECEFMAPLTPLFAMLCGVWCEASLERLLFVPLVKTLNQSLTIWLKFVKLRWPQISLESYGRHGFENIQSHQRKAFWRSSWGSWPSPEVRLGPRLNSFKFGPKPEHWHIEWDLDTERFASDFWAMVEISLEDEDAMAHMPGSWPAEI